MELQSLHASTISTLRGQRSVEALLRAIWFTVGSLLLLLCAFLALRRVSGGLQQPLPSEGLLVLGFLAGLTALAIRLTGASIWPTSERAWGRWVWKILPTAGLVLLAIAVTLPGSASWAIVLFGAVLVLEESAWWYVDLRPLPWSGRRASRPDDASAANEPLPAPSLPDDRPQPPSSGFDAREVERLASEMTQHVTRSRSAAGGETISGLVRGDFRPGERTQNLHLSFCPPLAGKPLLEAVQVEGPAATIKAAQVESFGARLELRLKARISRRESVVIRFNATFPSEAVD